MAIQFITGGSKQNKKRAIIQRLHQLAKEDSDAVIYYIIPEHLKFDMETFLLEEIQRINQQEESASIRIQVVSFTRLAWFLLPPKLTRQTAISSIGESMIIRQILSELQEDLYVFRGQIRYQGFIEKLSALFEEFLSGNIEPEDLFFSIQQVTAEKTGDGKKAWFEELANGPFQDMDIQRLREIYQIYDRYYRIIQEQELETHQVFRDLGDLLEEDDFSNYTVVIDHHYYFNAEEIQLLLNLARNVQQVYITLPIDQESLKSDQWHPAAELPKKTYYQLKSLADQLGISVDTDWNIDNQSFEYAPAMLQVAQQFQQNLISAPSHSQTPLSLDKTHHWWQADSIQTEVTHVSNQIHYLVNKKGYRYSDIVVLTRDLDLYRSVIEPLFPLNDLPFFYDHQTKMNEHPLVVLLESFLNLHRYRWKYSDLFAVLKSDLIYPDKYDRESEEENVDTWKEKSHIHNHRVNLFENVLLANGYFNYRLIDPHFQWKFPEEDDIYYEFTGQKASKSLGELTDDIRQWILTHFVQSFDFWKEKISGRQAALWLYHLVEDLGIQSHLMRLRDQAIEEGQLQTSLEHEQAWEAFLETIEEFYTLYSTSLITFDEFYEILLTGLKESTFHVIPPTIDQITITSMESPQVSPYKVAFILGADEFSLPKQYDHQSLLDKEEREEISENLLAHQFLVEYEEVMNAQEFLLAHQLLLSAKEALYISYASSGEEESVGLSPYFQQILDLSEGQLVCLDSRHHLAGAETYIPSDFGKLPMQISPLFQWIRCEYEEGREPSQDLQNMIRLLAKQFRKDYGDDWLNPLIYQLFTFNELPENLQPETAQALFGKNLSASVSKIEEYYRDPYSHFLIYGLRLKEREMFEMSPIKTGDYFHESLDLLLAKVLEKGQQLQDLTSKEMDRYLGQIQKNLQEDYRFNVLSSTSRMQAILQQMNDKLRSFVRFTQQQQKQIKLSPQHTELIFGNIGQAQENFIPGLTYPLKSGGQLSIRGKIDRMDLTQDSGKEKLLQIVDYKSGNKNYRLLDTYYGLDLQILTYLKVAMEHHQASDYQPLGGFYQPMIQSFQKVTQRLILDDKQAIEKLQLGENTLNGFIVASPSQLEGVEPQLATSKKSLVYPATLKKDGDYTARTPAYTLEEYDLLMEYLNYLFQQAGNQIQAGEIALKPFQDEEYTPSTRGAFRVITGFDATESYEAYRHKESMNKSEIMAEIHQLLNPDEKENDYD